MNAFASSTPLPARYANRSGSIFESVEPLHNLHYKRGVSYQPEVIQDLDSTLLWYWNNCGLLPHPEDYTMGHEVLGQELEKKSPSCSAQYLMERPADVVSLQFSHLEGSHHINLVYDEDRFTRFE